MIKNGGALVSFMECFNCGNCKTGSAAYYCLMKDDFVLNQEATSQVIEKRGLGEERTSEI